MLLRGLDKVSGQTVDVQVPTGDTVEIFGLDVALGDCRYPSENPTGDAFAYLTIWENGKADQLFDGCAASAACQTEFPDFEPRFFELLDYSYAKREQTGEKTGSVLEEEAIQYVAISFSDDNWSSWQPDSRRMLAVISGLGRGNCLCMSS